MVITTSAVVVAFHRADALAALLDRLAGSVDEIVVVNVEADPRVSEVVARARGCEVSVVGNVGFAAAANLGAARARGDVLVVSNDDVLPDPGAVALLVDAATQGAVAFPLLVNGAGRIDQGPLPLPTPGRLLLEWALLPDRPGRLARWLPVEKWRTVRGLTPVAAASAAMFAAPRGVLMRQPLPEEYFLYWEEIDWCWRLERAAVKRYIVGDATVRHEGGRRDLRAPKEALLARNAVRCVRRTQGRAAAALAVPIVALWTMRLFLTELVRAAAGRSEPSRVTARLAGVRAGAGAWREVA